MEYSSADLDKDGLKNENRRVKVGQTGRLALLSSKALFDAPGQTGHPNFAQIGLQIVAASLG